jgi:hypothetical protein
MLVAPLRLHRDLDIVCSGEPDCPRVAGIRVTENARARVTRENPFEATFRIIGAVSDYNHPSVLREANANAAAIVDRNP